MTRRALPALLAATLSTPPLLAYNVDHYYVGPTNSLFSSPANWSLTPTGPGGSPPADSDNAIISPNSPLSLTLDASPGNVSLSTLSLTGSPAAPLSVTHTGSLTAMTALIGPYTSYTATGSAFAQFYPIIDGTSASLSLNAPSGNFQFHQGISVGPSAGGSFSISDGYVFLEHPLTFGGSAGTASGRIAGGTLSGSIRLDSAALATVSQTAGRASVAYLGRNASYSLSGGSLSAVSFASKDPYAPPLTVPTDNGATFTQTGGTVAGTVNVNPYSPSSPALYSLAGTGIITTSSTLTIASAYAATFLQTGGTVGGGPTSSTGDPSAVYLGRVATPGTPSTGTYSLSSTGQFFANRLYVGHGDHGTFSQSGGSVTLRGASPTLSLGTTANSTGTYALSAGTLSFSPTSGTPLLAVGDAGSGTFIHSGGTLSIPPNLDLRIGNAATSDGTYSLSGSASVPAASNLYVGFNGRGTFAQSGGADTFSPSNLYLGYNAGSSGSYSLSDGSLSAYYAFVGYSGAGTLAISGGTAYPISLHLAENPGSSASLSLTGGTLAATDPILGNAGPASITHSGGTLYAPFITVTLGNSAPATTSYSLSGSASLVAGALNVGKDPTAPVSFAQSGGTVSLDQLLLPRALAPATHAYSLSAGTLTVSSLTRNDATFSQSGGTASFSSITGTGSISLTGIATLTANSIQQSSLSLSDGAFAALNPSTTPSSLSSLTLSGAAALNLSTDTLLLNHPTTPSPADTIRSYLLTNRLISFAADATHRLAYSDTPTTVTLQLSLTGDANLDGKLDPDDYALLDKSLAQHLTDAHWTDGDFNYDGAVDASDYLLIDRTLGQTQGFSPGVLAERESQFGAAYVQELLSSVPEPTTPALISLAFSLLSLPRPRRPLPTSPPHTITA